MSPRGAAPSILNWRAVLGIGISAVLLWVALRGVDFGEVAREISRADPWLFLGSAAAATGVFVIRAWRWKPLTAPLGRTSFRSRFAATTIGFMANNLLPARVGEFARAYALARIEPITLSGSFGSLVVERLLDGFTIVIMLVLVLALPSFPEVAEIGGRDLGSYAVVALGVLVLMTAVLGVMVLRPARSIQVVEAVGSRVLPRSIRRPVVDALRAFLAGLGVLRRPGLLLQAAAWSVVLWLFNAVGFWLAFRAFDIPSPFTAAIFLQSIISLAVAVPSAPGFFGVWEYAARAGLVGVWGVEATKAVGFAIGFHLAGFVPVTVIGLYYAWRVGITWREVEGSEEVVETAVETEPPPDGASGEGPGRGGSAA